MELAAARVGSHPVEQRPSRGRTRSLGRHSGVQQWEGQHFYDIAEARDRVEVSQLPVPFSRLSGPSRRWSHPSRWGQGAPIPRSDLPIHTDTEPLG